MTGITLAQLAALETEPLRKGIYLNIIRDAQIFEKIPFENVNSVHVIGTRWSKLPTGGSWRRLNAGYTASQEGTVEQVEESLFIFGGEITYDRLLSKITNFIEDPVTVQTKMKMKALAYGWKNQFINGDIATEPDGFEGLKKRVANLPSRQTVCATTSTSAAPLDPTSSTALARRYLDVMEEAKKYCNGGQVDAMFANEAQILGIGRVMRYAQFNGNMLDVTKDTVGREFLTLNGKPVFDMGYKADQSTEIITNTETAGDAGADSTSMYFASFDKEEGIYGIQLEPMKIYDPLNGAESPTSPAMIRRVDWANGLAMFGSYGLVRLWNIAAPSSWT